MIKHAIYVAIAAIIAAVFLTVESRAMENIIRPWQSIRSAGMGNVRITTGIYDENFFGNPARVVDNPKWKIQLPDPSFESTIQTVGAVSDLVGGGSDVLKKIGDTAGTNLHGRIQMSFPGYYSSFGKTYFAVAFLLSTQFDVNLRRSYQVDPISITDIGPAITVGRRFLGRDRLAVGITTHATYRLSTKENYTFVNLIQGDSLSPLKSGGDGTHLEFDIGATYDLPGKLFTFTWHPGLSINNILGGNYGNLGIKLLDNVNRPRQQPRTYNFGISARRPSWYFFRDLVVAFEITDIGNNENGSLFRLIHIGSEAKWSMLAFRLGLNQGYPAAGLGMDFRVLELDLAYWGEEMTLNAGGEVDNRIALRLQFKI